MFECSSDLTGNTQNFHRKYEAVNVVKEIISVCSQNETKHSDKAGDT
jgi:hypothetical protein